MSLESSFEIWEIANPWAPIVTVVLPAGLVNELSSDESDPRREELSLVASELMSRLSGRDHQFGFTELKFREVPGPQRSRARKAV